MVSLSAISSRSPSTSSLPSKGATDHAPAPPDEGVDTFAGKSLVASASSSKSSLVSLSSDQDVTIRMIPSGNGKRRSQDDLRLLAASTHMTEISYNISDIQTRIFEIQELRHKAQPSGDGATDSRTSDIDTALMNLDERLEQVSQAMAALGETIAIFQGDIDASRLDEESSHIVRKHSALLAEWEAVQDESDVLREELKEDKWLTLFRNATEQADGMMTSIEKAVNKCHEFIWQVQRRGPETYSHSRSNASLNSELPTTVSYEVYLQLLNSYEAKKKYYMPATTRVLSVIDNGVANRVTKNGECLRRHAEAAQRWKSLRDRIARIDKEMESLGKFLLNDPSEIGSSTSIVTSKTGKSARANPMASSLSVSGISDKTSKSGTQSRQGSAAAALSRSISPFRKLAQRVKIGSKLNGRATPTSGSSTMSRAQSSEPVRQRASLFPLRASASASPATPDREWRHGHSQSMTPDSSPSLSRRSNEPTGGTVKSTRPPWNSSTRADDSIATVKLTPPKRPSAYGIYGRSSSDAPPVPALPTSISGPRSLSRSSFASSRPWSPVTSSVSTTTSSHRPAQHSRPVSPTQANATMRLRPSSPSHIPGPASRFWKNEGDGEGDELEPPTSLMQRVASPAFSDGRSQSRVGARTPYDPVTPVPRPPSRSMIPMPSFKFSSPSRPGSAMSQSPDQGRSPSSMSFTSSLMRAQTPEWGLKAKLQQIPFYTGSSGPSGTGTTKRGATPRPSIVGKAPPSSFRDNPSTPTGLRSHNRSGSRTGNYTPGVDGNPVHEYTNVNHKDPLDVEIAAIVNSIPHGLLVERVDPPLRTRPPEGAEVRAQYAFTNALSRKVITCKLTTMTRTGKSAPTNPTKKVMCRVGGGWQDLQFYMLNRQSGM